MVSKKREVQCRCHMDVRRLAGAEDVIDPRFGTELPFRVTPEICPEYPVDFVEQGPDCGTQT